MRSKRFGTLPAAAVLILVLLISGCGRGGPSKPAMSDRGPGLRRQSLASLQLPVPRTFELTHVDPAPYVAALGNDPTRIFEFVRDAIAFEAYVGLLRGPRGTLLAMAGNSIDRAALLGAMLERAGQRVRYARGTLPEKDARDLVMSMWAERSRPAATRVERTLSPELKAAFDTLTTGVKRDYALVRDHLKKMDKPPASQPVVAADVLVKEAQSHFWVQWAKDGGWTDLDPSFGDASPGRTYARTEETLATLGAALFHRVDIRVRLEEYANDRPASRVIFTHRANASDLSATALILVHVPERWKGPAESLEDALQGAIQDTGRVKPVVLIGEQVVIGEPFRQKLKTTGIGGIAPLLGGEGTRKAALLATGEWLEFDFIAPDGRKDTVVREIFDLVGKARRAAGRTLTADEVRTRTGADSALNVAQAVYNLFFTTGRVDVAHFKDVTNQPGAAGEPPDASDLLQRIGMTFVLATDTILARLGTPDRAVILFYPDSPRLLISELSAQFGLPRIAIDLRRDHARVVAAGPRPDDAFAARIFRGVVDGTLERVLVELVTAGSKDDQWGPTLSTSLVSEKAQSERISWLLLPRDASRLGAGAPDDTLARIRETTSGGLLALVPQRPVSIGNAPRLAWWQIDPRSGETVGVGDDGLHAGVATEYNVHKGVSKGKVRVSVRYVYGPRNAPVRVEVKSFEVGVKNLSKKIAELEAVGAQPAHGGLGSVPFYPSFTP